MAWAHSASRFALLVSLLVVAFALPAPDAQAQVYKWVDKNGRTHYGEKPPDGVKATEVGVPAPGPATAPASPAASGVTDWKARELEMKRKQVEREQKARVDERDAGMREQRCARARQRLAMLNEQVRLYDRNDKGERVYLDDRDRPAAIAAEQARVDEYCR